MAQHLHQLAVGPDHKREAQACQIEDQRLELEGAYGKEMWCQGELTGSDMSQFLLTLTELVLPRIRTFRGVPKKSGDKFGNISIGLDPEDVKFFPEIEHFQELFPNLFGFHITFKTSARTDDAARVLLSSLGLPFENAPAM